MMTRRGGVIGVMLGKHGVGADLPVVQDAGLASGGLRASFCFLR